MKAISGNFYRMGEVNVSAARFVLHSRPNLWSKNDFRTQHPLSPHKATESVYLRFPKAMTAHAALYARDVEDKPGMDIVAFSALVVDIEKLLDRPAERAIFVKLLPGGCVAPHIDQGPFAEATNRYHTVLETNQKALMQIEGESWNFTEGGVYYFNKHAMHSASNLGVTPRVHLIMDFAR
jgi:aspartyl/asparaginyl beta-hydroxylase